MPVPLPIPGREARVPRVVCVESSEFCELRPGLGWLHAPSASAATHSWSSCLKNEKLRASFPSFFVQFLAGEVAMN